MGALHGNTITQDCEESEARTGDEADLGLSGEMLEKQSSELEADTGLSGDMLHEHPAEDADSAKGIQESDSNETVHVKEKNTRSQDVKDLTKEMNASCIGEQISSDEFLGYFDRLPRSPRIFLDDKLEGTAIVPWISKRFSMHCIASDI